MNSFKAAYHALRMNYVEATFKPRVGKSQL
jgi:hypothetical protein